MLNLIRLRPEASYADGRTATGKGAWKRPVLQWDEFFVAEYPSMEHFKMLRNAWYRQLYTGRRAVADSRLIRIAPVEPGEFFQASQAR
jgi:hypothetical protein